MKSLKLEIRFINIQQDTLTFTVLISVEQISKNFWSCFKVLEYEFITEQHQQCPNFWYIQACDQTIFKGHTRYNLTTLTLYIYLFVSAHLNT